MEGLSNAEKLQAVINTLATLNMPSTFDNVNTLTEVRDDLHREEEEDAEDYTG